MADGINYTGDLLRYVFDELNQNCQKIILYSFHTAVSVLNYTGDLLYLIIRRTNLTEMLTIGTMSICFE